MWDKLSISQKAQLIKSAVQSGITDLNFIRDTYNEFKYGGYGRWKKDIKKHKGIDVDKDNTYDYRSFYNENRDMAMRMLKDDPEAHFPDTYKTSVHPTFSQESRYSGTVNRFNPTGITGGRWEGDHKYIMSQDQLDRDWDTDSTLDYLEWADPNVKMYAPDGESQMLRSITATPGQYALGGLFNKFDKGGPQRKRKKYIHKATGREYDTIPKGWVVVGSKEYYDLQRQYRQESLNNVAEQARKAKPDSSGTYNINGQQLTEGEVQKLSTIDQDFIWDSEEHPGLTYVLDAKTGDHYVADYDIDATSDQNTKHRLDVKYNDKRVSNATAFERPLNLLSPGQWFDATVKTFKGDIDSVGGFFGHIYNGNSGWVPDSFARDYPRASAVINFFGDAAFGEGVNRVGGAAINKGVELWNKPNGYTTAYHGSPYPFDIENAWMGTSNDMGLHLSKNRGIAQAMAGENGIVYKTFIPEPSLRSVDLGMNGVEHLGSKTYYPGVEYSNAGNNWFERSLIEKQGSKVTQGKRANGTPMFMVDKVTNVPLSKEVWPGMSPEVRAQADGLLFRNKLETDYSGFKKINEDAARLFSENGHKTIEYNNSSYGEGKGGTSYIVTDPNAVKLVPTVHMESPVPFFNTGLQFFPTTGRTGK